MSLMRPGGRAPGGAAPLGRVAVLGLLFSACQMVGPPAQVAPEEPVFVPIVSPGPIDRADEARARQLLDGAERSFDASQYQETIRLTREVFTDYPASSASGAALLLCARATYEEGEVDVADGLADRYAGLLPAEDARLAQTRLLQAERLEGRPADQLARLLHVPAEAPDAARGRTVSWSRELADTLDVDVLATLAADAPRSGPASGPVYAKLAVHTLADGDVERATELAIVAMEAGAGGNDLSLAEGVLRGELPEELRPDRSFTIATVLPVGGPPGLAEYAGLIGEGIEVALTTVLSEEYDVSVLQFDDQADPVEATQVIIDLEEQDVAGVIGFLQDDVLLSAGQARLWGLPIVSPTARSAGRAGEGVYSLDGADVGAAESVARYAVERAFQRVAMIYPDTPEAAEEADAFQAVAADFGIPVVGRYPYPAGATHFEDQLEPAQDALRAAEIAALGLTEDDTLFVEMLEPVGLFMPIPAEDVEFVAPQFAHFGLDTLAIEIMGTSGWTDPAAMESVDSRLLDGIVATSPLFAGPGSPGYARFRQAYEAYYQRSLVSSAPALGYDATLLLLEALRPGRVEHEEVRESFSSLLDVEGATGLWSVVDGRVVRRTEVVWIDGGRLIPILPF